MQESQTTTDRLETALRDRVLERLGFSEPPAPDLAGLRAFYRAWCANVPFDNVRKLIALRSRSVAALPGTDATEFFEAWLVHGAGGTCWPTSNALYTLARSLGFEPERITGAMRDLGIVNHASVRVRLNGDAWLVDSSMLTNAPLPLGRELFVQDDPAVGVEVEPVDGAHVVWVEFPPSPDYLPCRLFEDPVDHDRYRAGYELSRERGAFNQRLYARRNRPGEVVVLLGNTRFTKSAVGLASRELSPEELTEALRSEIGVSGALHDEWVRSGALDASFEPPNGPKPPPDARKPPSKRRAVSVLSGEDRFREERGLGISTLSIKVSEQDTGGRSLVVEQENRVKGGPPRHRHFDQDEWFYAIAGEYIIEIGGERIRLGPGDSVLAPRNVPHTWAFLGGAPGRLLIGFTPAGKMEAFFRELTKLGSMPPQDPALWLAHGMELVGPPLAV
jgi:quercetin 2,3-dioxygenase